MDKQDDRDRIRLDYGRKSPRRIVPWEFEVSFLVATVCCVILIWVAVKVLHFLRFVDF